MKIRSKTWVYVITVGAALAIGGIGALFTTPEITTWYATLIHPSWTPPSWVFAPVWNTLYLLMGISAGIVWLCGKGSLRLRALWLYWLQLAVNLAWSIVFFGLHSVLGGLVVIALLLILVVALIDQTRRAAGSAAWLLAPYLLWLLYATSLNLGIYFLN